MNAVYDAARKYSGKGWSVIPIAANQKKPAVKWVQDGYAEKRPSFLDLQGWFAGQEKNLAIITGKVSGLLVVDIDNPELFDEYRAKYPTGLIAQTPKGGYHLYYKYDGDDIGNSVSRLQSGIDVRCRHGYVLAAPSHVKYEDGREGDYKWLSEGEATPLPDELRERILADLKLQYTQNGQAELTANQEDGHSLWVRVLSSGFTSGKHNQEAKDCARYLFRQGMNEGAIINTLLLINQKDATPLPAQELINTIRSGIGYERDRLEKKGAAKAERSGAFTVKSLADVVTHYEDFEDRWLIKDWIPEDSVLMVASPPENYKTWLLLDAAISLAVGEGVAPFLGSEIDTDPMPVMVVQQEDFMGRLVSRMRAIMVAKTEGYQYPYMEFEGENGGKVLSFGTPWLAPIFLHTDNSLSLEEQYDDSLVGLETEIKKHGIKFVAIDPFYMLGDTTDHFAKVATRMWRIKEMRDKYGVTFMFAHHTKKSEGSGRTQILGSQLLNAAIEGGWLINLHEGQRVIERFGKSFPGKPPIVAIDFDISTTAGDERYIVSLGEPVKAIADDKNKSKYDEPIIEFVMSNQYATRKKIVETLGFPKDAVSKRVKALKAKGELAEKDGRLYIPMSLPEGM